MAGSIRPAVGHGHLQGQRLIELEPVDSALGRLDRVRTMNRPVGLVQLWQPEPRAQLGGHRIIDPLHDVEHKIGAFRDLPGGHLAGRRIDAHQSGAAHLMGHRRLRLIGAAHDVALRIEHHEVRVAHLHLIVEGSDLTDEDPFDPLAELRLPELRVAVLAEEGCPQEAGAVGELDLQPAATVRSMCGICDHLGHLRDQSDILPRLQATQFGGLGAREVAPGQVAHQIGHRDQLEGSKRLAGRSTQHLGQWRGQLPESLGAPRPAHSPPAGCA
ncbi:hypothetical protein SDC9_132973 [bioreactor metagenome]|uniref:Uncharacterized protein n=1 Tax=bioreactor metagenome TaxID=1076179 RepID=A0A645D8M6_9ZZZZ